MRIVFVGAVESSAVALRALLEEGIKPELTITLRPEAASRHSDFADLRKIASGLRLLTTNSINEVETLDAIGSTAPDICLVVGWSQICGSVFREIPKIGSIGFHPSPLPRLRGRAVIPWTILQGEAASASTLFWLDAGVDSGDILLQRHFSVSPDETARTLYNKHVGNIAQMVPEAMRLVSSGEPPRIAQDHTKATYCAKRTREDGLIDWQQPAEAVLRLIRAAGDPYPGAFTLFNGKTIAIDDAVPHQQSNRFVGLAGQVQAIENGHLVVRCGDGKCVVITGWKCAVGGLPRLHGKFQNLPGAP